MHEAIAEKTRIVGYKFSIFDPLSLTLPLGGRG